MDRKNTPAGLWERGVVSGRRWVIDSYAARGASQWLLSASESAAPLTYGAPTISNGCVYPTPLEITYSSPTMPVAAYAAMELTCGTCGDVGTHAWPVSSHTMSRRQPVIFTTRSFL